MIGAARAGSATLAKAVEMISNRDESRPVHPDPAILQAALTAARPDAAPGELSWACGPRLDRPQSTLFPLRLVHDGATVLRAFYKVHRVRADSPGQADSKLTTFRRVLERGPHLRDEYARLAATAGISVEMPAFLAVDVDRLTEVQTALPGRPVDRVLMHAGPGMRSRAMELYRALGAAVATIERCRDSSLADEAPPSIDVDAMTRPLGRVLQEDDLRRLRGLFDELHAHACRRADLSYSHGDFGRGNFFISPSGAGLIDALWSPRWRGDDIAYHAVRLRHELPRLPSWTSTLISELLAGYGDETLAEQPEWLLTQLRFEVAVGSVNPRHPVDHLQRRQAVNRVLAALGPRPR